MSNTKSNEWYTPAKYIEAARLVMGGIDLDPASCELANQTVKATTYYGQAMNGLMQPWYGRVWLNPPYGRENPGMGVLSGGGKSLIACWVKRLSGSYESHTIEQATLLVTADTDAKWFSPLFEYPICFADHRVLFNRPNLPREGQIFSSAFVYLGPNEVRFIEVFSKFGRIVRAIDTPPTKLVTRELWEAAQ